MEVNDSKVEHIPVLAETLVEQVNLPQDGVMVDATIGQGGHSFLFGVRVEMGFGRTAFCDVLADCGSVEITVKGFLTNGQSFYGRDTIKIKCSK